MGDDLQVHRLAGDWSGTDRLWFRPEELANESPASVYARPTLGGQALVYEYGWSMGDDEHHGTLLVTPVDVGVEVAWIDTFHTSGTIMALTTAALGRSGLGPVGDTGPDAATPAFDVLGSYGGDGSYGDGVAWGWRMRLVLVDHEHLVLSHWNVTPEGEQLLAVLGEYERVIDPHGDATI
jgi:hypothetical protein